MRIIDWSSDVCSSDLTVFGRIEICPVHLVRVGNGNRQNQLAVAVGDMACCVERSGQGLAPAVEPGAKGRADRAVADGEIQHRPGLFGNAPCVAALQIVAVSDLLAMGGVGEARRQVPTADYGTAARSGRAWVGGRG